MTKKETIRKLVFAVLDGEMDGPDPRECTGTFSDWLTDNGHCDGPKPSNRRYVRFAVQDWREAQEESRGILNDLSTRVHYDEESDAYRFWPPGHRRAFAISGDNIREMKRQYSNPPMGEGLSINQLCQAWGLSRDDFVFIKRELHWTHDQDEFTDEEHESRTSQEMLRDRVMRSRGQLHRDAARRDLKQAKEDAAKWRAFAETVLDDLREAWGDPCDVPRCRPRGRELAVFSPADLHIGKLGIHGYTPEAAHDAVMRTTVALAEDVLARGCDAAQLVLGNDWMHIDTPGKTTTRGTPQDSAPLRDCIRASVRTSRAVVEHLRRSFGGVTVRVVPSNHDQHASFWLVEVLAAYYAGCEDVDVIETTAERQYQRFGRNLLGFEHGDGAKESELPLLMAREAKTDWSQTDWRYWHTGHLHHLKEVDRGVVICQAPSLSGHDRWHDKKGYVTAERANVAYVYDQEAGQVARLLRRYAAETQAA